MRKRVYIETTIPSFYFESRPEPEMVARRNWTRAWWDERRQEFESVTSDAVLDELEEGIHPHQAEAKLLISDLPRLPMPKVIDSIVEEYIHRRLMPNNPRGDALHLALASHHRCQFLLTWNCRHLANPNKIEHIKFVNAELGLICPLLVTPFDML